MIPASNKACRPRLVDASVLALLLGATLLFAARSVDFSVAPTEDAAILMRYAEHLADGHGIVWNVGEAPVDGATDFLFLIVVAGLHHLGLALEWATRGVGIASHLLTVALIYIALRRTHRAGILPAAVSALYLAVGPGLHYAAACFGTPFFALFAALTFWLAVLIVEKGPSMSLSAAFALAGLVTGLIRPEGVVLAGLILLAIVLRVGFTAARPTLASFVLVFGVLGAGYFAWRWSYFGHPLPNPLYRKGELDALFRHGKASLLAAAWMSLPFLPAFVLGLRSRELRRRTLFALIPVVGFAASFAVVSDAMNFGSRFQYATLPIVLLSWYPLVRGLSADLELPELRSLSTGVRNALLLLAVLLVAGSIRFVYKTARVTHRPDGLENIGRLLADYRDEGYSVAVTEAGLIPLYSGWRTLDTWGLNDAWIVHNGGITESYLDEFHPDLIMFHSRSSPFAVSLERDADWGRMIRVLSTYAEERGYLLAAVFGDSVHDTHTYYVRRELPRAAELADRIRRTPYPWSATGRMAVDLAHPGTPTR